MKKKYLKFRNKASPSMNTHIQRVGYIDAAGWVYRTSALDI